MQPIILSLSGTVLSDDERRLFAACDPFGFILFARNIDNPEQLRALTADLRACTGRDDLPILIDQEGGRVQRLQPPHWHQYPPMAECNNCENVSEVITQIAAELSDAGINVDCAPVLDVPIEGAHDVIGDRAFSSNPDDIAEKGDAACRAFLDSGITPVIKHIPGHGRATCDSHHHLPIVDTTLDELWESDFIPFKELSHAPYANALWAMSAHIIFTALDPDLPVTLSPKAIRFIREEIGFAGLLMGDDVSMSALDAYGSLEDRCKMSLEAGCDLALYCAGHLNEMEQITAAIPTDFRIESLERYERSKSTTATPISGRSTATRDFG